MTVARSAVVLLRGQLAAMRAQGYRVVVICSPEDEIDLAGFAAAEGVEVVPLTMTRGLASPADVRSLVAAVRVLRRLRPSIVNASTPKAALVVGLAARLAGVPVRIYSLWGLRLEGERPGSLRYRLLHAAERATCGLATTVLCASGSLRDRAVELRLVREERTRLLGRGSTNGIDLERFHPFTPDEVVAAKAAAGFAEGAFVVGFVGRLVADKGIEALLAAFETVAGKGAAAGRDARLLLVGDLDAADPLPTELAERIRTDPRIHVTGVVADPARWYPAMDVFVLPSRREGLPNVLLEAAACALPTVTTSATGCPDAVDDGRTGIVVGVDDAGALGTTLAGLAEQPAQRQRLGAAGRTFVERHFAEHVVWERIVDLYRELRNERRRAGE
ncbi:glycosyltransferase family 4 protein [Pseudonocardia sp. TRM90224]|uniref:glycosyltransferase family 4 protein n=1 Tax=Pseudonocardia sp. TRM90224 TaxID=2812678 RepID=UPI001E48FF9C|nr:glycosyltransferase family 4 protein [Pseudonocardia sp. TRM90224]